MPNRILFYEKIVKGKYKKTNLFEIFLPCRSISIPKEGTSFARSFYQILRNTPFTNKHIG